ncbi:MAG: PD40 domain-containing protein [Bacteroidetes bacterium]|nr:PD40 domain-containing protein [Bacteroidota bacterium]
MKRLLSLFFLVVCIKTTYSQFYYGSQLEFGKNRLQYQSFNWTYFDFERFRVYLYEGGQEIARYAATSVDRQLPIMEKRLDFQLDDKIDIIVYNNQNDFKQSNIGLASEENGNIGGVTRIIGDKIFIYFTGSHADLDKQIRAALAELMVDQMMYGGRTRDIVRNSTLLALPYWFKNGLIAYLSEGWNSSIDNRVMDAIQNDKFLKFNQLTGKEAIMAGHAMWYYVAEEYGEAVIPNLLYMTKVSRNPNNAFLYVLGTSVQYMTSEFTNKMAKRYFDYRDSTRKNPVTESVLKKQKKSPHYYQLKVSPDGQKISYATNELGQYKVFINTIGEKKVKRLIKLNPKLERLEDNTYPLIAWHPNNTVVSMIYERKNVLKLHTYDTENKETNKRNVTGFEKVNSYAFSHDGKRIVMSAVKKGKGQSDIFIFTLNSGGVEQITNDAWDDNSPVFVDNSKGILFQSNRTHDTIKGNEDAKLYLKFSKNSDIFYYNAATKSNLLYRVTNTPDVNETSPQEYSKGVIAYLGEANGVYNRYIGELDSSIAFVDTTEHYRYFYNSKAITNYQKNIQEHHINARYTKYAEIIIDNFKERLMVSPLTPPNDLKPITLNNTWFKAVPRTNLADPDKIIITNPVRRDENLGQKVADTTAKKTEGIDFENYDIKGEKKKDPFVVNTKPIDPNSPGLGVKNPQESGGNSSNELRFPIQQNYYTSFKTDQVVTQLDNSFLGTNYQRFTGGGSPVYLNPGLNALFKIGLSDLFEDKRIVAGFRIAGSLDNEYLLSWENRIKNVDRQLVLHRQSFLKVNGYAGVAKILTHDARYTWKIPFSEVSATKLSIMYRNDRTVFASVSDQSLPTPNAYDNYGGAKVEYIFDNTRKRGLNLYNGTRFKMWAEYWRLVKEEQHDLLTMGFDFRNYKKIHRDLIWANRVAGATSLGKDRLVYYLGGVDNWLNPQFDNSINIVKPEQYQFQTLATNLRGFKQNIRNGNNFVVWNSEVRWPIFKYLLNRPIRSDFVQNFQIIGFGDLGMAWYDVNPYSDENVLNKNVYVGNPVTLTIFNQKEPIVGGYGFGLRSRLLGYFIRVDFAWGVDDKKVQKGMTYLSLTTDF